MAEQPTQDDKLWAGLSYVGLILLMVPTIVIFVLKKDESDHIKFHSLQALALGVAMIIWNIAITTVMGVLPFLALLLAIPAALIGLALMAYWVVLVIWAFTGKEFRIPVLGDFVEQQFMK